MIIQSENEFDKIILMISAVVLAKNEEGNIKSCLKSLNFCGEVIVIDDNSEDKTVKIARKFEAKVFSRNLDGDFAKQRNFGLKKAKGEWVLFIDADERVNKDLAKEIKKVVKEGDFDGFYVKRRDIFLGRELKRGETASVKLLRLGRGKKGKWIRKVHETWDMSGKIGVLKESLDHNSHPTLDGFVKELNWMSTLHAQENQREEKYSMITKTVSLPIAKFFNNFFIKLGIFDGTHGFVFAVCMSFHSFLAWSKLWLIQKRKV